MLKLFFQGGIFFPGVSGEGKFIFFPGVSGEGKFNFFPWVVYFFSRAYPKTTIDIKVGHEFGMTKNQEKPSLLARGFFGI